MFLFRRNASGPQAAASSAPSPGVAGGEGDSAPSGANRESLAFKAARFLGGAARNVGASIKRAVAGQSAEELAADLEKRASGDGLAAALADWARLLAATDDTPRYECRDQGSVLTFRAGFLQSRAFELSLSTVGAQRGSAGADGGAAWPAFLRAATLPGGDAAAADLPTLLADTCQFPECRRVVEEAALLVKADARHEQLRSERASAGARAEEIRASLRAARRAAPAGGSSSGVGASNGPEEVCRSSAEAVGLYAAFRSGLQDGTSHLRETLAQRRTRLQDGQHVLKTLLDDAIARGDAAVAKREELQQRRDEALVAPRRAVEEIRSSDIRASADARLAALEDQRRKLQVELEETSKTLAAKRDERVALHRRREEAMAEHRRQTEALERQLTELRPGQFHRVVGSHADAMTEGEIVAGLAHAAASVHCRAEAMRKAMCDADARRTAELSSQSSAVDGRGRAALREHARLELTRLDAAGATAEAAVKALSDAARSRDARGAMGLVSGDDEGSYASFGDFREVRRLRKALKAAEAAWTEAAGVWGGTDPSGDIVDALAPQEDVSDIIAALEGARSRFAQTLAKLQRADPAVYEMAMRTDDGEAGGEAGVAEVALPHGWEAHQSPEGAIFYYNLVSQASQWEAPEDDAAVCAGWRLCQAEGGQWFYHNPYDGTGHWWPELPSRPAVPVDVATLHADAQLHSTSHR